jgi:hypothetical protein
MSRFVLLSGLMTLLAGGTAIAQCPAIGNDTGCGTVITITDSGATVTQTGQGPYDGSDDTLVGVVNNSSQPVALLNLSSGLVVFGFDGDGIDSFGVAGNAQDSTGYGGPNAYFSNINAAQTAATVNFITPIAAKGGTSYFSLEMALANAVACSSLVNGAISGPNLAGSSLLSGPTQITATFTPNLKYSLQQAAALCGFVNFDWIQQIIRLPDPSPFYEVNPGSAAHPIHLTANSTPFNDPAPNGYTYNPAWVSFPFYWDPKTTNQPWSLVANETPYTLSAFDSPKDPCLAGPLGLPSNAWLTSTAVRQICGNRVSARGASIAFVTHLAGVKADGTGVDLGVGYTWTSNFNGTFGGIAQTASVQPADPGSGEGGITIVNVSQTTNYQYQGITVNGVNGSSTQSATIFSGDQVSVKLRIEDEWEEEHAWRSGQPHQTRGRLLVRNRTNVAIAGPVQVVFELLPSGVTVQNASGSFGGFPYITLKNGLPACKSGHDDDDYDHDYEHDGCAVKLPVVFQNLTGERPDVVPVVYTGSFN